MSLDTPPAAPSMLARVRAWAQTHRAAAAGIAGAGVIGGFALYQRHAAGGNAADTGDASAADPGTAAGNAPIAGLTSDGYDPTSEIENYIQDQLNAQNSRITDLLNKANRPRPPKVAPPAPKPGAGTYRVQKGDTLAKVATYTLGDDSARNIGALRVANPILASFPKTAKLDWLAGDLLRIPRPPKQSAPKPRPQPKPRRPRPRPRPPVRRPRRQRRAGGGGQLA